MSKTRFLPQAAAAVLLGAALHATPASALSFIYTGPSGVIWELGFSGFSTERSPSAPLVGATSGPSFPGTNETTWGAGYVTSIYRRGNPADIFWAPANATFGGGTLSYMIYGIADLSSSPAPAGFKLYNNGCVGGPCDGKIHIDFYLDNTNANGGTNPGFGTGPGTIQTDDRTGFSSLTGITDGIAFMNWELIPTIGIPDDPLTPENEQTTATLFQNVNALRLPAGGDGFFYAECVSGPGCDLLANGAVEWSPGLVAEVFGRFTLDVPDAAQTAGGWNGRTVGPTNGVSVPEPATLAAFGSALVLLGAMRRRRR